MPGPIPYGLFYQAVQQRFPGRFSGTPADVMDAFLEDFPELDQFLDPTTKGSELLIGPPEPARKPGPVGGVSGLPPVSPYYRQPSWTESAALLGVRVAPAVTGAVLAPATLGTSAAAGAGGAMAGEALAEAYEEATGIAPASHANILTQTAIGAIPVTRGLSKVPGIGPGVNKLAQSALGRTALGVPEGVVQGALSTEADIRLRQDRPPTLEERAFGAIGGGVFGGAAAGAVEGVQAVRSMRAQGRLGRAQHQNVNAIVSFVEQQIATGQFTREFREQLTPQLENIFQHIQDPELRQTAAERLENLFLQAHQQDLTAMSAQFVQEFQQQAPTMGLYDRMQLAQAFTDRLRLAAADQETIDQTATILAGLTPGNEPQFPPGLPPASDAATGARQGPFYGVPPEGPTFVNRPDSELPPPGRQLPGEAPTDPPPLEIERLGDQMERTLNEPPGPPRLIRRPEEARLRRPGAGVLRPELTPQTAVQPRLRFRGQEKGIATPQDQPPMLGEAGPLPLRREGRIETSPRVVKGELTADRAFLLEWLAADLEQGKPVGEAGGGPGPDLTNVRKEDEAEAWRIYKQTHSGYTNPGTPTLFGLNALGATEDRPVIAQRIRDYLSGKSRKPTKSVQAALKMIDAWQVAYDPATGSFDWSKLTTPLPEAKNPRGERVPGYEPAILAEMTFPDRQVWADEPRWLVEKYAPRLLAPEEQLPTFAQEYGQPPREVQEFMDRMLADDQDLLEFYDSAIRYGDVEPAGVGWVMHEIERRGLRQFRQPGLQTEGPGSPARRNLPREIAESQPSLFDEPLPENPTPQLAEPEFSLTPEVAERPGFEPALRLDEPPAFGEPGNRRMQQEILAEQNEDDVLTRIRQKLARGEPLGDLERRKDFESAQRVQTERRKLAPEPPRLPDLTSERGAVGRGPTRTRATRKLTFANQAFDDLQKTAKAGAGREVAGVLLGSPDGGVRRVVPMRNVAADPSSTFELDPHDLARVLKGARSEGLELLASYHTQPTGSAEPSKADMRGSVADVPLVILGMDGGDITDARVWQPGRNRQWAEGTLGVATLKNPDAPPVFQDIKDVTQFVRAIPRLRASINDAPGVSAWLEKNRAKYSGEAWFVDTERLLDQGQTQQAWVKIQSVALLGERAARAGIRGLPDPTQSAAAVGLVDALVRGGAQDPVGSLFALFDGRTVTVPGVGRVVTGPEIPPNLHGTDVFTGPGGIISAGDRKKKLVGRMTDGTLALDITKQVLQDVDAPLILKDPTGDTSTRLFRQIAEQMLISPANFKAVKALLDSGEITVQEIAQQYTHVISTSARHLAALSVWQRQNQEAIRYIEGIKGAAGDVEDLIIKGKGGRVIGRLGDLTADQTFDALVKPTRAWDRIMLANDLSKPVEGAGSLLESASRGFMISQFATAMRNLEAAGLRGLAEQFDLIGEGVAQTMSGNQGKASAAFRRAAERAKIPYRLLADGTWVGPRRAIKDGFDAIIGAIEGTQGRILELASQISPEEAHLLGGVAFGEPTPHGRSKHAIVNALINPKVQNTVTVFNRMQEFTVRANIYAAEMRAAYRGAGINPDDLRGMSIESIAEQVGGMEALQALHHDAVSQALNFSFAGDLAEGSLSKFIVDVLNMPTKDGTRYGALIRAGYPFPRFNLSAAPRFIWDHSGIGLFADLGMAAMGKGRFHRGRQATRYELVEIPEATQKITAAEREQGDLLLGRMALQRRLGTYRKMVNRAERQLSQLSKDPTLPGIDAKLRDTSKQLDLLRAERNSLTGKVERLGVEIDAKGKAIKGLQAQRDELLHKVKHARAINAPRSFEQLLARQFIGGGALFAAAWLMRSAEGAQDTPWYIHKIPKPLGLPGETIELDFRPFAPFAQYLFLADTFRDVWANTAWTDETESVWADMERGEANNPIDLIESIYNHYEGKYTADSFKRELGNAFLSMSQVAGTTLALADMFMGEGIPDPTAVGENAAKVFGSFLARFTIPFAQIKPFTDLVSDDESKARIAEPDRTQFGGSLLPIAQPLGNLPFLGALLIPETVNQITGKPLDTYAPLLRALTGITARERTALQDTLTEAGVAPSSIYLRDTGDPFLDRLLGFHYANTLGRALPQILEDPDWQRLTTPAQRRDFLQQLLPKLKASAIGETLEDSDPEVLQSARETREGRRRRLRMERLQRLIDAEGLRPSAEPDAGLPEPEEPEPPEEPPADEPPAFEGSASGGPPPPPF